MKITFASVALAVSGASASQCCFGLDASGGVSGHVGQLSDGQLRVNQQSGLDIQNAKFCLSDSGMLTDSKNRGCIFTAPTTQLQCDVGATPNSGLALNSKSMLAYNGATTFYACPTGQAGGYNVYSKPVANMPDCVTIQLTATGNTCAVSTAHATVTETVTNYVTITGVCAGTAPAAAASPMLVPAAVPSPLVAPAAAPAPPTAPAAAATLPMTPAAAPSPVIAPAPVVASAMPTTMATSPKPVVAVSSPPAGPLAPKASSCPANLKGEYQNPHLIVPVDSSMPDKAYGTSYNGEANGTVSSIFNFDIPQSYAGQTCSLIFLFPKQSQLQTSSYNISGDGQLLFWLLNGYATQSTTYNNKPSHKSLLLQSNAQPGNSYIVSTGACAAGQRVAIELAATKSYALDFFQDYNPSPIGLYITRC